MIKSIYKTLILICLSVSCLSVASCSDYLDKSPDAGLSEEDIFGSFEKFQGFIENAYYCMHDPITTGPFNFADDVVSTKAWYIDNITNDYRTFYDINQTYFYAYKGLSGNNRYNIDPWKGGGSNGETNLGYWEGGWLGIRKANLALEHLDMLRTPYGNVNIEEQRNLIEGQALLLRAILHFNIIRIWGGMPYITKALTPDEELRFPRLNYHESSDKIEEDLLRAAELLPDDWQDTPTGQMTYGTNKDRFTRGAAYAALGKAMLYAASPLMNGTVTGSYTYNEDYLHRAVKYLGKVLEKSEIMGGSVYGLEDWKDYSGLFYRRNSEIPCSGKEGVLNVPQVRSQPVMIGDTNQRMNSWIDVCGATENYVQNFGMSNGEPFDPSVYDNPSVDPWADRDPRFYTNIVTDRSILMKQNNNETKAELYVGGQDYGEEKGTITGYMWKKYRDEYIYPDSGDWYNCMQRLPVIRLADVYLMYAEAANELYGPDGIPEECRVTAVQALKAVRERVKNEDGTSLPTPDHLVASKEELRETIRRERAVELCYENHRWYDTRRWYVAHLPEYKDIKILAYDKDHTYYSVESYHTPRIFEQRHYWFPLKREQSYIYGGFYQNPGWE